MPEAAAQSRKLLQIDAYSLVYRAFFALPSLSTSRGQPISAVYGFDRMLQRALSMEKPTHVAAAFDAGIPAQRLAAVPQYKAQRPEMPGDLRPQFPLVRRLLETLRIRSVEVEGEEADDCIATLAARASAERFTNVILSGDLDLLQLVDEHCTVLVTRRGVSDLTRYDESAVRERYGLSPKQLPDFRGLKGDPSDNLPGVPGIGEKTAAKLIAQFGSLDNLLAHAGEVTPKRIADLLAQHGEQARKCRDVSQAKRDLAIHLDWSDCEYHPPDPAELQALYSELEFRSLMPANAANRENVADRASRGPTPKLTREASGARPATLAAMKDVDAALKLLADAAKSERLAVAIVPELESWRSPRTAGIALSMKPDEAWLIGAPLAEDEQVWAAFARLMESPAPAKNVHDSKTLIGWLRACGLQPQGISFDTQIAQALVDPARGELDLLETAALRGALEATDGPSPQASLALFADGEATGTAGASAADLIARLTVDLTEELDRAQLRRVYDEIELPLAGILADMERVGFRLDLAALDVTRASLDQTISRVSGEIFALAEEEFNLNSPKALGTILFEKLKLPAGAKTKTGYSTGIDVLAPLALEHQIVAKIIEYREVSKLKSTYVDALPGLVDPQTHRLHTTLHQLGAATGRLASANPNLQNIPIRSEVGRTIRRAFLPPTAGHVLLAADYSQIELRLMAHMSEDPNMIAAFTAGEDFHAFAARAVFGVPADQPVPAEMRRRAKAVNFGILYGMGPHGLAQSVGFSRSEARAFIDAYFARFPSVRRFIDATLDQARATGYVATLMGRRRYLPDINSSNRMLRAAAERMAVNAPLQGSAADLIKLAMVRAARRLADDQLPAQLLLQVHDELIFEVAPEQLAQARAAVQETMEGVAELHVPLVVELKSGPNWGEVM